MRSNALQGAESPPSTSASAAAGSGGAAKATTAPAEGEGAGDAGNAGDDDEPPPLPEDEMTDDVSADADAEPEAAPDAPEEGLEEEPAPPASPPRPAAPPPRPQPKLFNPTDPAYLAGKGAAASRIAAEPTSLTPRQSRATASLVSSRDLYMCAERSRPGLRVTCSGRGKHPQGRGPGSSKLWRLGDAALGRVHG